MKINKLWPVGLCILLGSMVACEKTTENQTKAVFSYVADGFRVNFTNFSNNATSYHWDFGDGDTAISRSPMHIYRQKGDFLVTLTATSGNATSTFTDSVVVLGPNIRIDDDLSDWDNVPYAQSIDDGSAGNMVGIKIFGSPDFLYFYLEGTPQFNLAILDLYIDADNNPGTGFATWMYPMGSGADFLIEGTYDPTNPLNSSGNVFKHTAPDSGWGWETVATFGEVLQFGPMKNVGGKKALEFGIRKSILGNTRQYVNFGLIEMDANWTPVSSIPVSQQDTSKFMPMPL